MSLYLTGHSLGGAAATLAGARLLSVGVNPEQLKVITFGAPAVGNVAFAAKFDPNLPLVRIVNFGDVVPGVLQTLVGGYQQFGREIKWYPPDTVGDKYQLIGYIDSAIKNYYDKRRLAIAAGIQLPLPSADFRWTIVSDVSAMRIKQEENTYRITLTQTVYDVTTGTVATTATFSTATYNLTPLEAFIHTFKGMKAHLTDQFEKTN